MKNEIAAEPVEFVPVAISKERTIVLNAPVPVVFPLFEPLNEKKWVKGWNPNIIYPMDGKAMEHMIFTTQPRFDGEERYRWILTYLNPVVASIQYTVSTVERIWFISIACESGDLITKARISYTFIGLTERGHELNEMALEKMFAEDLKDWEAAINEYLSSEIENH